MTCILQLTDLHLMSDPQAELRGARTREIVEPVLRHVRAGIEAGRWVFDRIVLTGDLAHDEQRDTYLYLRELLGDWLPRCVLIPGNHDDRALIREVFPEMELGDGPFVSFSLAAGSWQLIGIDSHVPGEVSGRVSDPQLEWLRQELARHAERPTVLFMHHPPFDVRSVWLDRIGLLNADAFWETVRPAAQVRAVCAGHVHQQFESDRDSIRLLTSPSASLQFKPQCDELVLDTITRVGGWMTRGGAS